MRQKVTGYRSGTELRYSIKEDVSPADWIRAQAAFLLMRLWILCGIWSLAPN
jgi:hypothetical protein